jgi:hypothetical protein
LSQKEARIQELEEKLNKQEVEIYQERKQKD